MMNRTRVEKSLAVAAFVSAAAMAFLSLCLSGKNEISSSALWYIAQALTYSATMLGIKYQVDKHEIKS